MRARRPATQEGVPVAQYVPAPYGPPVVPDTALPRPRLDAPLARGLPATGARIAAGARTVAVASPPRRARSAWRLGVVLLASAVMTLLLWPPTPAALGPFAVLAAHSHPAATTCAPAPTQAAAARALTAIQLASRLRDAANGDFRPADATTSFRSGQTAYLTFEIATNAAGTAAVLFCTAHEHIHGTLRVPANSSNRYGQFSAVLAGNASGRGEAILTWDGQVAAAVSFTLVPGK